MQQFLFTLVSLIIVSVSTAQAQKWCISGISKGGVATPSWALRPMTTIVAS